VVPKVPAVPEMPPIFVAPREGAVEVPTATPRSERRRPTRADRAKERTPKPRPQPKPAVAKVQPPARAREPVREQPRAKRSLGRVISTLVLLGVLATAVALVLAQSAGMIHLPFLGNPL
jgi:hypothetical protein